MNVYRIGPDLGDAIASLATVKYLGRGHVRLYNTPGTKGFSETAYNAIKPLIEYQDYCASVSRFDEAEGLEVTHDFTGFRSKWGSYHHNLLGMQAHFVGVDPNSIGHSPWIKLGACPQHKKIVFCRSVRNQGSNFFWGLWWQVKWRESAFIGVREDYDRFCADNSPWPSGVKRKGHTEPVPFQETSNLLDAARFIAGARLMLTNQTAPCWLAHAIHFRPLLVEKTSNDTTIDREGVHYIDRPEHNWNIHDIMRA